MTVEHRIRRRKNQHHGPVNTPPVRSTGGQRSAAVSEYAMLPPTPSVPTTMMQDVAMQPTTVQPANVTPGNWYPASTVQVPPPGSNGVWVYWPGGEYGWLYSSVAAPTQVKVSATQAGGPSGLLVYATAVVTVPAQAGGYGSTYPVAAPRYGNPESECSIDLDALALVCSDTSSPLHGADLVEIMDSNGDLVSVSFRAADGVVRSGRFPVVVPSDTPWWKEQGHCCEDCALGHECEGEACSTERAPNPAPRRRPIFGRR